MEDRKLLLSTVTLSTLTPQEHVRRTLRSDSPGRRSSVVVFSVRCYILEEVGSFGEFNVLQDPLVVDRGFCTRCQPLSKTGPVVGKFLEKELTSTGRKAS